MWSVSLVRKEIDSKSLLSFGQDLNHRPPSHICACNRYKNEECYNQNDITIASDDSSSSEQLILINK